MTDILKHIKGETREWHERIERLVPVFNPSFSIEDYRRLLGSFSGFYVSYESALEKVSELDRILPDWPDRRKTPWLTKDLMWLGYTLGERPALAICSTLPRLDSPAAAMGALYVTEGSTLGGQIISRHLEKTLNLTPAGGATFFAAHGRDTGLRWKIFTDALCGFATPRNEREIIQAANETFETLWLWLGQSSKNQKENEYD